MTPDLLQQGKDIVQRVVGADGSTLTTNLSAVDQMFEGGNAVGRKLRDAATANGTTVTEILALLETGKAVHYEISPKT